MSGKSALRACMTGLVLLNLVFVQLTEATGFAWLAPLYLLAALSPLLVRFHEQLVYRALWNAGVLGVFALLVRHATGDDLRYVLEDGLVLAALCQVHLLNNLRSGQRPDLLFLNSFLIAIITGYLCRDLAYPIVFLAYVPLFIIALELHSITQRGSELRAPETRVIVADGLRRSVALLGLTLLVFLFWPRDFKRRGLLSGDFDFKSPGQNFEIGFSDKLQLDNRRQARASDRIVMRVTLESEAPAGVPALWRGATLNSTNGEDWFPATDSDLIVGPLFDDAWMQRGRTFERAPGDSPAAAEGPRTTVTVEQVDPDANVLFAPLTAREVRLGHGADASRVQAVGDGVLLYGEPLFVRPVLQYTLSFVAPPALRAGPRSESTRLSRYTALPQSGKLSSARALAAQLSEPLGADVEQHVLVTTLASHLSNEYEYLLPGVEGAAQSLAEFLAGGAGGHCEFFASGLATMLRSVDVPCRLVTGYRSEDWDPERRVLTFRRRQAHAWVEVLDPTGGWYTVDPTPPAALDHGPSLIAQLYSSISLAWSDFTSFDEQHRAQVRSWLRALPRRVAGFARQEPLTVLASVLVGLAALGALRQRRLARTLPGVRAYRVALRRARVSLIPGETPRELLLRVRDSELQPEGIAALEQATRTHERERYAA